MSSQTGDTGPSSGLKWFIGVVISLLAAGGGIVALLNYFHPAPPPSSAQPRADVIVCLTDTRYVADPNPAPDRGVVEPVYLQTTFDLRNRGSAQANVTFIHLAVLGIKNGAPITSNPDYGPRSPIPIAGNGEVPHVIVDLLVDQRAAVQSFESAQSRVDWEGGTGQTIKHIFDGAQWQNDPACSS